MTAFEIHLLTPTCCRFITFACNCPHVDLLNVKCSSHSESKWRFSSVVTRWSWCRSLLVFNLEDWRPENRSAKVFAARRGETFLLFVSPNHMENLFEGNESNMLLQKRPIFPTISLLPNATKFLLLQSLLVARLLISQLPKPAVLLRGFLLTHGQVSSNPEKLSARRP